MKTSEFNNKQSELLELLKKAQMIAAELSASESARQKEAERQSFECLDNDNEYRFKAACGVRQNASQNSSNLNATYNSIKNEIERIERVVIK